MTRKSVTGSKLRGKTPILCGFNRANLVPVTDFRVRSLLLRDRA
jgi:hypothetical protein